MNDTSDTQQYPLHELRSKVRDKEGRMLTVSLFFESNIRGSYDPLFTLKDYDHTYKGVTYPSLKRIYLSYDHIPGFEYDFAIDVFGSWDHWQKLLDSTLKDHFLRWREELEIKVAAKGIKAMAKAAMNPEKGVAAAKYLADRGWKQTKGRPSKAEVERERKIAAGISEEINQDMERLGLTVINGGK